MENEGTVTLREEEVTVEAPITEEVLKEDGILDQEIELAKKHGIIKKAEEKKEGKDGELQRKPVNESGKEPAKVDGKKEEVKEAKFNLEDLDSFEKVHDLFEKSPDKFRELPRHVRALYHNSKGLYKRAKTEEQKRQDLEKKIEFESLRNKGAEMKLERIRETLKKDELTTADIEAVLGDKSDKPDEKPKEEDVAKARKEFLDNRVIEAEKLGRAEHDDFEGIVNLAQSVIAEKPRYAKVLQDTLADESATEKDIIDLVVDIARLHKDFGVKSEKKETETKTDATVDRMVKNSQKKPTSAAIGGGAGGRVKGFDDITPEDVLRMSQDDYNRLPPDVRSRLKEAL